MLRHEASIGNSNRQPLELLKPKWAGSTDIQHHSLPEIYSIAETQLDATALKVMIAA
jgi:hypothetical protein